MTLKRQVPSVAAAIFLAVNVVNVLSACIPSYWSNGDDSFSRSRRLLSAHLATE